MFKLRSITTSLAFIFRKGRYHPCHHLKIVANFHLFNQRGSPNILSSLWQFRRQCVSTLSPSQITELLSTNEICLDKSQTNLLPACIKSIECNQLASNNPIEDRLRISSICLPNQHEPTIMLGVFDGHGGGTTVDLISRRLFNYIAVSLHPNPEKLNIADCSDLNELVVDLCNCPSKFDIDPQMRQIEFDLISCYKKELSLNDSSKLDVASNLKDSFQRCDNDLSQEIQEHLLNSSKLTQQMLRHYLSAAVSGCCAIVLVIHQGIAYVISSGDCRAVLGIHDKQQQPQTNDTSKVENSIQSNTLHALDLNDEHNCDNINEIRRLSASHPKSEQNTMIKHNRLLGHLMPFRAFGDFTYKWPAEIIEACGITRACGAGVIPARYETPPYLIVEPDVNVLSLSQHQSGTGEKLESEQSKYLIMATDGLWELFESSRDVIETIVEHSIKKNAGQVDNDYDDSDYYDLNCATHVLRAALCSGPYQEISLNPERIKKLHHIRLESTLTLPKSVARNFRDDISIILIKLN